MFLFEPVPKIILYPTLNTDASSTNSLSPFTLVTFEYGVTYCLKYTVLPSISCTIKPSFKLPSYS